MAIQIYAGETVAANKRVYFHCVDATDGMTPETGEAGGQPQISINGAAFADAGIGVLVAIGNGRYYAVLTDASVEQPERVIESRYKSANTAETVGTTVQVLPDPTGPGIDIYVHGTDGDDSTGDGSAANPYATITKSLTDCVSGRGDRIHLMPGTYTLSSEASYPISIDKSDVSILGPGQSVSVDATTSAGQYTFIILAKHVTLKNFRVVPPDGKTCTIGAYEDDCLLEGLYVDCQTGDDAACGAVLGGARARVIRCFFSGDSSAVVIDEGTDCIIEDCVFTTTSTTQLQWPVDFGTSSRRCVMLRCVFAPSDGNTQYVSVDGEYIVAAFNVGNFEFEAYGGGAISSTNQLQNNEQWATSAELALLNDLISGGTGAHSITLYVKDDSANPVAGQAVTIPTAGVQLSAASTGAVSFNLDAGTYTVTVRSSAAYTPESSYTVVVDASGNVTTPADAVLEITAVAITPPDSADECRVYGYVYDQNNDPVENAVVKIKMYNPPGMVDGEGVAIQSKVVSYTTNASGYWYADLVRSSEFPSDVYWEIDCPAAGYSKVVVVPNESTVSWEDLEEAST